MHVSFTGFMIGPRWCVRVRSQRALTAQLYCFSTDGHVSRFALLTPITNLFALLLRLLFVDEAYRLVNDSKNDFGKRSLRSIDVIFSSLVSRLFSLSLSLSVFLIVSLPVSLSVSNHTHAHTHTHTHTYTHKKN